MATIPGRLCSRGLALLVAIGLLHGCCSDSTWQQNANGPDYGGTDSPTGDDVWVSCNPTTGFDASGTSCVRSHHTPLYTHDPNRRDSAFRGATSGFAMGTGGLDIPTGGGIGTQDSPALSCTDLARLPHFSSGMYWLFPPGAEKAFRGWCDMDSFGGGWLVCYTSEGGVHMATETESDAEFPADGYRSDCRDLPFNQVMYIKHGERASDEDDKAWFSFQGSSGLVARRSNFRGAVDASWAAGGGGSDSLLFEAHAMASKHTPKCGEERNNIACRFHPPGDGKVQECPDCFAESPQRANSTCQPGYVTAGTSDKSSCWCDAFSSGGCSSVAGAAVTAAGMAKAKTMNLKPSHDAVTNFYQGWILRLTAGTGTGQQRKVVESFGGACSTSTHKTRGACFTADATWTPGENKLTVESPFDPLPCSDSKLDAFVCYAQCSDDFPSDGSTCNRQLPYSSQSGCLAACKGWNPHTRTHTVDDTGADGGATTLVDTDGGNTGTVSLSATSETVEVVDAEGAGITRGKRLRIGGEVLLVYDIAGNQVRASRGQNGTTAAAHLDAAAVVVEVDYAVTPVPFCSDTCTSTYELVSPSECTEMDWQCGYAERRGERRGYTVQIGNCAGTCTCDNVGVATCSAGAGSSCSCQGTTGADGEALTSPWNPRIVSLSSGETTDACAGPLTSCVGENPYAGYKLTIGSETRSIVGYSGVHKVVMVDTAFTTPPTPAPAADPTWASASDVEMKVGEECSGVYDNAREKAECAKRQRYQLMICDAPGGLAGGFIMSGWDEQEQCRKGCDDLQLCEDSSTAWFRADTGRGEASGVVFSQNGKGATGGSGKLSVAVRLVDNEKSVR